MSQETIDPWYTEHLVCPRDHSPLRQIGQCLRCSTGHEYPLVEGVPVLLLHDVPQTAHVASASIEVGGRTTNDSAGPELYLDTLGLSDEEKRGIARMMHDGTAAIDPVVSYAIAATNGIAYKHLIGKLQDYPIPDIRLPEGKGRLLLDIGCNWGRWSIAAARLGYNVVGIDPSLASVLAARRVSRQFGLDIHYVVGDARYLPLPAGMFDTVFSYSVLQHLSPADVRHALHEVSRVLKWGGMCKIQMATAYGLRCLYHQARRGFREANAFEVRYWSIGKLKELFESEFQSADITVDCYFGLGLQVTDWKIMAPHLKAVIAVSELLRFASRVLPFAKYVADSVYVEAWSRPQNTPVVKKISA